MTPYFGPGSVRRRTRSFSSGGSAACSAGWKYDLGCPNGGTSRSCTLAAPSSSLPWSPRP
jgi:hypothetical protein